MRLRYKFMRADRNMGLISKFDNRVDVAKDELLIITFALRLN